MYAILKTLAAVAFIAAGPAAVSAQPMMAANTNSAYGVAITLPNGMQFEAGLTPE